MGLVFSALIVVVLGLIVLLWTQKPERSPLLVKPGLLSEKWRLSRKQRLFDAADKAFQNAHSGELPSEALSHLHQAFCIDFIFHEESVIESLHLHHQALVSRILEVAGRSTGDLEALEIIEDLLVDRDALLREFADTKRARIEVIRKQREKGKTPPDWAIAEFQRKIQELEEQLQTNGRSLSSKLSELFHLLRARGTDRQVVYH